MTLTDDSQSPQIPQIDDKTATDLWGQIDTATPQQKAALNNWADRKLVEQGAEQEQHFDRIYSDFATLGGIWNPYQHADLLKNSINPDQDKAAIANTAYIAHEWGMAPSDIGDANYPTYRDKYAWENFGKTKVTDTELYGLISKDREQRRERVKAFGDLESDAAMTALSDAASGKVTPTPEKVGAWLAKNQQLFPGQDQNTLLQRYGAVYQQMRQNLAPIAPEAKKILDALGKYTGSTTGNQGGGEEGVKAIAQQLTGTSSPEERQAYYQAIALASKGMGLGDDKGFWTKMAESLGRGLSDMTGKTTLAAQDFTLHRQIMELKDGAKVIVDEKGNPVPPQTSNEILSGHAPLPSQWHEATGEDKANLITRYDAALKQVQIVRELKDLADGTVDPIKASNTGMLGSIEGGLYGAARTIPYTLAAGVPVAGPLLTGAAIWGGEYDRMRLQYPDMNPDALAGYAVLSAAPQALLERLEFNALAGHAPVTAKFLQRMADARTPTAMRALYGAGANVIEQNVQEGLQDITPVIVDNLAHSIRQDMPQFDGDKALKDYVNTRADTFFALLPMVLIGGGATSFHEWKRSAEFTKDAGYLTQAGFSPEVSRTIAAIEDPEKRFEAIQEEFPKRTPENIQAGIEQMSEAIDQTQQAQESPDHPTLEVSKGEYVLKDTAGKEVFRTGDEQAAHTAYTQLVMHALLGQPTEEAQLQGAREQVAASLVGQNFNGRETSRVLQFQDVSSSDSATGDRIAALEKALREDPRAAGKDTRFSQKEPTGSSYDTQPGSEALAFIRGFEGLTGKKVVFVDTTGEQVPFAGAVLKDSYPNTIFLHTRGERNVLALVGHEWGHTLSSQDSQLYEDLQKEIFPFIDSWKNRSKELLQNYDRSKTSEELTNNIIGDAFAHPDFWKYLSDKNKPLFQRVIEAVKKWFAAFINKAHESEFGTESFITDLESVHRAVMNALEKAAERGPYSEMPDVSGSELSLASQPAKTSDAKIAQALEKLNKDPAERLAVYERIKERLIPMMRQNRDVVASMKSNDVARYKVQRQALLQNLGTLDAMLSVLPPEVRGKVGGYTVLAKIGNGEKALTRFFADRLDKINTELESTLQKEYRARIDTLLDKAEPTGKAGEKPKGKLGAEGQRLIAEVHRVMGMDGAEAQSHLSTILADIVASEEGDSARLADLVEKMQIAQLFGDYENLDSSQLAAAHSWLDETYRGGREKWKAIEEQRRQQVTEWRERAIKDTGASASDLDRQKLVNADQGFVKNLDGLMTSVLSFEQTVQVVLGRNSELGKQLVSRAREATIKKRDALLRFEHSYNELLRKIFPNEKGVLGRQQRIWEMKQIQEKTGVQKVEGRKVKTVEMDVEKAQQIADGETTAPGLSKQDIQKIRAILAQEDRRPDGARKKHISLEQVIDEGRKVEIPLSEMQALHLSMLWAQDQYKAALEKHGWTAETMGQIEDFLSDEAKMMRGWMANFYDRGHTGISEVFRRMYGVDLPKVQNYAPGTFEHENAPMDTDPYGHGLLPEGGTAGGFLKGRKSHVAMPRMEDALSVLFGHNAQTEHWKAFAELNRDLRSVLLNPEVRRAAEAGAGKRQVDTLKNWVTAFERNGIDQKTGSTGLDALFRRINGTQAYLGLAWNVATLMKQSTAVFGSLADMPSKEYLRRFAKLVSGQLQTGDVFKSPMIQERMKAGYSPEMRTAMASMWSDKTKPGKKAQFLEKGMQLIGMTDAIFTTGSAAIAYDYHLEQATKAGIPEAQAKKLAMRKAEETVARTAQPSEMMDRSMFELGLAPTARSLFMFRSEARQKAALTYMAIRNLLKKEGTIGEAARTALLTHVIIPVTITAITSMWRDARDPGDEDVFDMENWSPQKFAIAMAMGSIDGLPLLGDAVAALGSSMSGQPQFSNTAYSQMADAYKVAHSLWKDGLPDDAGKAMKMTRRTMTSLSLALGGEWAVLGVSARIAEQLFSIGDNFTE